VIGRLTFVLLLAWASAHAADPPSADTRASTAAKAGLARKGEYHPDVRMTTVDRERVKALADQGQARAATEKERLKAGAPAKDHVTTASSQSPVSGRVVVAVSSSMPEAMLTSYLQQLDGHPESLVVMRGFVGGAKAVRPTGQLMERLRRKSATDPHGSHFNVETVVDPLLFRQLGIDQVPAVAWLSGVQDLSHCDEEDYSKATVVFGAVSVEAALREARKAGAAIPESVIARYRGTGWERKR
jgi:type-F conjugative transfer system pilin assembly protein TrbC